MKSKLKDSVIFCWQIHDVESDLVVEQLTPARWHGADSNHWRYQQERDSQFLSPLNPSPSDQRSSLWQLYTQIPLDYLSPWLAYTSTEKIKTKLTFYKVL